jgi:hypothetical protein
MPKGNVHSRPRVVQDAHLKRERKRWQKMVEERDQSARRLTAEERARLYPPERIEAMVKACRLAYGEVELQHDGVVSGA